MPGSRSRTGPWYDGFRRRLREATGDIQQVTIAEKLSMSQGGVSRWYTDTFPEPEVLPRLAALLGVSVDWLLGGSGGHGAKHLAEARPEYVSERYHMPVDNESRDAAPAALKVPIKGSGEVAIPIDNVPKPQRHRLRSMVSARLQKLSGRELMFLRLDGGFHAQLQPHDVLSVKEIRGDGGPHIVVVQVIAAAAAEPAGGAHPQRATMARGSGRPRNVRRKPGLDGAGAFDEDDRFTKEDES